MKIHVNYFFVLLVILVLGIFAMYAAIGHRFVQLGIGILMAVTYIVWGVSHHHEEKELHPKVVIEYILIAAIAVVLMLTMAV